MQIHRMQKYIQAKVIRDGHCTGHIIGRAYGLYLICDPFAIKCQIVSYLTLTGMHDVMD